MMKAEQEKKQISCKFTYHDVDATSCGACPPGSWKEALALEKPEVMKTHLQDVIIPRVPTMEDIQPGGNQEKIHNYLGEFPITCRLLKHRQPGIGATHSLPSIPLK
ncbi:40S ribosomal protein S15 [Camelus dromedarius]|uniref:40S ribosomal protein S15 n=1 Tax=Camelus dromedarius TaxID=9838 RepID=A0A5N4DNG3_CAMDR|nr:40S ribosomal protein S15 [Camelus dromedarius]